MTKKEQKELDGLGMLHAFIVLVFTILLTFFVDSLLESVALDLFTFFFVLLFLSFLTPRVTGITSPGRRTHARKYMFKKEPQALIRDLVISLLVGTFMALLPILFGRT